MDTSRIFDTLDRKIEKLLERLETVEGENEKLKADLASARRAEKDAADSRGAVEKLKADLAAARRAEKDAADSRGAVEKLKADLAAARRAEKDAAGSREEVERLESDQEAVRARLDRLITTLETAEAKKQ
jgi:predicted RNase H-like nuclease (RuvC/YqgF family)